VLTADDTLVGIRRAVTDAESRRTALDISLIRALGGGYRDTKLASGAK
jgi:outer membrane protein TolC